MRKLSEIRKPTTGPDETHRQWVRLINLTQQREELLQPGNAATEAANFLALCQQIEDARNSDDPADHIWLQMRQRSAQTHGLHPDAIAASRLHA